MPRSNRRDLKAKKSREKSKEQRRKSQEKGKENEQIEVVQEVDTNNGVKQIEYKPTNEEKAVVRYNKETRVVPYNEGKENEQIEVIQEVDTNNGVKQIEYKPTNEEIGKEVVLYNSETAVVRGNSETAVVRGNRNNEGSIVHVDNEQPTPIVEEPPEEEKRQSIEQEVTYIDAYDVPPETEPIVEEPPEEEKRQSIEQEVTYIDAYDVPTEILENVNNGEEVSRGVEHETEEIANEPKNEDIQETMPSNQKKQPIINMEGTNTDRTSPKISTQINFGVFDEDGRGTQSPNVGDNKNTIYKPINPWIEPCQRAIDKTDLQVTALKLAQEYLRQHPDEDISEVNVIYKDGNFVLQEINSHGEILTYNIDKTMAENFAKGTQEMGFNFGNASKGIEKIKLEDPLTVDSKNLDNVINDLSKSNEKLHEIKNDLSEIEAPNALKGSIAKNGQEISQNEINRLTQDITDITNINNTPSGNKKYLDCVNKLANRDRSLDMSRNMENGDIANRNLYEESTLGLDEFENIARGKGNTVSRGIEKVGRGIGKVGRGIGKVSRGMGKVIGGIKKGTIVPKRLIGKLTKGHGKTKDIKKDPKLQMPKRYEKLKALIDKGIELDNNTQKTKKYYKDKIANLKKQSKLVVKEDKADVKKEIKELKKQQKEEKQERKAEQRKEKQEKKEIKRESDIFADAVSMFEKEEKAQEKKDLENKVKEVIKKAPDLTPEVKKEMSKTVILGKEFAKMSTDELQRRKAGYEKEIANLIQKGDKEGRADVYAVRVNAIDNILEERDKEITNLVYKGMELDKLAEAQGKYKTEDYYNARITNLEEQLNLVDKESKVAIKKEINELKKQQKEAQKNRGKATEVQEKTTEVQEKAQEEPEKAQEKLEKAQEEPEKAQKKPEKAQKNHEKQEVSNNKVLGFPTDTNMYEVLENVDDNNNIKGSKEAEKKAVENIENRINNLARAELSDENKNLIGVEVAFLVKNNLVNTDKLNEILQPLEEKNSDFVDKLRKENNIQNEKSNLKRSTGIENLAKEAQEKSNLKRSTGIENLAKEAQEKSNLKRSTGIENLAEIAQEGQKVEPINQNLAELTKKIDEVKKTLSGDLNAESLKKVNDSMANITQLNAKRENNFDEIKTKITEIKNSREYVVCEFLDKYKAKNEPAKEESKTKVVQGPYSKNAKNAKRNDKKRETQKNVDDEFIKNTIPKVFDVLIEDNNNFTKGTKDEILKTVPEIKEAKENYDKLNDNIQKINEELKKDEPDLENLATYEDNIEQILEQQSAKGFEQFDMKAKEIGEKLGDYYTSRDALNGIEQSLKNDEHIDIKNIDNKLQAISNADGKDIPEIANRIKEITEKKENFEITQKDIENNITVIEQELNKENSNLETIQKHIDNIDIIKGSAEYGLKEINQKYDDISNKISVHKEYLKMEERLNKGPEEQIATVEEISKLRDRIKDDKTLIVAKLNDLEKATRNLTTLNNNINAIDKALEKDPPGDITLNMKLTDVIMKEVGSKYNLFTEKFNKLKMKIDKTEELRKQIDEITNTIANGEEINSKEFNDKLGKLENKDIEIPQTLQNKINQVKEAVTDARSLDDRTQKLLENDIYVTKEDITGLINNQTDDGIKNKLTQRLENNLMKDVSKNLPLLIELKELGKLQISKETEQKIGSLNKISNSIEKINTGIKDTGTKEIIQELDNSSPDMKQAITNYIEQKLSDKLPILAEIKQANDLTFCPKIDEVLSNKFAIDVITKCNQAGDLVTNIKENIGANNLNQYKEVLENEVVADYLKKKGINIDTAKQAIGKYEEIAKNFDDISEDINKLEGLDRTEALSKVANISSKIGFVDNEGYKKIDELKEYSQKILQGKVNEIEKRPILQEKVINPKKEVNQKKELNEEIAKIENTKKGYVSIDEQITNKEQQIAKIEKTRSPIKQYKLHKLNNELKHMKVLRGERDKQQISISKENTREITEQQKSKISEMKKSIIEKTNDVRDRQSEIGDNQDVIYNNQKELQQREGDLDAKQEKIAKKATELNREKREITANRRELTQRKEGLDAEQKQLNEEKNQLTQQKETLIKEGKQTGLERFFRTMKGKSNKKIEQNISEISNKLKNINAQIEQLKTKQNDITEEQEKLKTEEVKIDKEQEELNKEQKSLDREKEQLENDKTNIEKEQEKLNEEKEGVKKENKELSEENAKLDKTKEKLDSLEKQIETKQHNIEEAQQLKQPSKAVKDKGGLNNTSSNMGTKETSKKREFKLVNGTNIKEKLNSIKKQNVIERIIKNEGLGKDPNKSLKNELTNYLYENLKDGMRHGNVNSIQKGLEDLRKREAYPGDLKKKDIDKCIKICNEYKKQNRELSKVEAFIGLLGTPYSSGKAGYAMLKIVAKGKAGEFKTLQSKALKIETIANNKGFEEIYQGIENRYLVHRGKINSLENKIIDTKKALESADKKIEDLQKKIDEKKGFFGKRQNKKLQQELDSVKEDRDNTTTRLTILQSRIKKEIDKLEGLTRGGENKKENTGTQLSEEKTKKRQQSLQDVIEKIDNIKKTREGSMNNLQTQAPQLENNKSNEPKKSKGLDNFGNTP